ncbi:hypothetical protein SKAU_G00125270 [Synaphobranchus kaupii]|uniref:Uncharacterized protein n=1 Tax=Synaphobranchus kaupii TaxID=118154 RepID=A0A9Q1J2F6_SYNKA|nr:hypothetical protein SKAU_G00125270 [Synaphobranchus kaupii]
MGEPARPLHLFICLAAGGGRSGRERLCRIMGALTPYYFIPLADIAPRFWGQGQRQRPFPPRPPPPPERLGDTLERGRGGCSANPSKERPSPSVSARLLSVGDPPPPRVTPLPRLDTDLHLRRTAHLTAACRAARLKHSVKSSGPAPETGVREMAVSGKAGTLALFKALMPIGIAS